MIGLAVAETLLKRGCRVLLTGRATHQLDNIARKYGPDVSPAQRFQTPYVFIEQGEIITSKKINLLSLNAD